MKTQISIPVIILFLLLFGIFFLRSPRAQVVSSAVNSIELLHNGGLEVCTTDGWQKFVDVPGGAKDISFNVMKSSTNSSSGNCYMKISCANNSCSGTQSVFSDVDISNRNVVEVQFGGKFKAQDGEADVMLTLWELGSGSPIAHSKQMHISGSSYQLISEKTYIQESTLTLRLEVYTTSNDVYNVDDLFIKQTRNIIRDESLGSCTPNIWSTFTEKEGKQIDIYAVTDPAYTPSVSPCFYSVKCADGICDGAHSIYQDVNIKDMDVSGQITFGAEVLSEVQEGLGNITVWQFLGNGTVVKAGDIPVTVPSNGKYQVASKTVPIDPTTEKLRFEFYLYTPNVFRLDNVLLNGFNLYQDVPVYRFYNKTNGAHLYTSSTNEIQNVLEITEKWNFEGNKYSVLMGQAPGTVPVHRFFNTRNGAHLYTISDTEKNTIQATLPQFTYEGIKYYVYESSAPGRKPVYRFLNTINGAHLYTTSVNEANEVIKNLPQFEYEGIKYYVL